MTPVELVPTARDTNSDQSPRSPLISYEAVAKDFRLNDADLPVVHDINLQVYQGEIITLVGPSGCGKTTLLNMAAGLFAPTRGAVLYRGMPISSLNHRVGYMTQSDHLLPWRTVAANIAAPLEILGIERTVSRARVSELIELVGLTGFENSFPAKISGGMKKRTALARLLAYDPEILLMDEPFGALDAQLRLKMQIELRALAKRLRKTVLFVTHDLDEAVALGDRCVAFSARPSTILEVLKIPLPADRDLLRLRFHPDFNLSCAHLWSLLSPQIGGAIHE